MRRSSAIWLGLLVIALAWAAWAAASERPPGTAPAVVLERVPDHGLQPQAAVDGAGGVHLLYFTGDPQHGDLNYAVSADGGKSFGAAIRVNSLPGSAVAIGNMRGGHLALGAAGQVYAAWMGSDVARQVTGFVPMLFSRLKRGQTGFSAERNLAPAGGLDGGAIAADRHGRVEVYWHAMQPGQTTEAHRAAWAARSSDDGATFQPAAAVWTQPTGACGCCGMAAATDRRGNFYLIYRGAREMVHRDLYALVSHDGGQQFQGYDFAPWTVGYCVMSTSQLLPTPDGIMAAWEQEGQVYFGHVTVNGAVTGVVGAPGGGRGRKYPALAVNRAGQVLLAWTEGMGWQRGGSLHWRVLDGQGVPLGSEGMQSGVPMWSLIAAWARPDGSFCILY